MNHQDLSTQAVRVWDLPTRVFHWTLALAVLGLVITGKVGGNAMVWHMRLGLLVGALLVFRIVWGMVGGRWSRFASFVVGPAALLRYLRGQPRPGDWFEVGHNPLGAGSVMAMLVVLAVQVGTGLVSDDEIATTGPLNKYVAGATGLAATGPLNKYVAGATGLAATAWHKTGGQWLILGLVALHVLAIVVYTRRGKRLLPPMISGDKQLPGEVPPARDTLATRGLAAAVLAVCLAAAVWVARQAG